MHMVQHAVLDDKSPDETTPRCGREGEASHVRCALQLLGRRGVGSMAIPEIVDYLLALVIHFLLVLDDGKGRSTRLQVGRDDLSSRHVRALLLLEAPGSEDACPASRGSFCGCADRCHQ